MNIFAQIKKKLQQKIVLFSAYKVENIGTFLLYFHHETEFASFCMNITKHVNCLHKYGHSH